MNGVYWEIVANPTASRLLLVKLSSLGDVVHALPLAQALRSGLGADTVIAWAVSRAFAPLVENNPYLSWTHVLPSKNARDLWAFGQELRSYDYDTVMDAQGLFVSGAVTLATGAFRRVGFDTGREGNRLFLTDPIVPNRERVHVVDRLLGFCESVNVPRPERIEAQSHLATTDVSLLLEPAKSAAGPLVGCIIGASVPEKTWAAERWIACLRMLSEAGMRPILLGAQNEADAANTIARGAGDAVAANLVGQTNLLELASVLAKCAVAIGPDSGPTHLAVAVGTPVVGLYGVTDPAKTGPDWGPAPSIVLDYAEADAPPETRRPRHPTLTDALARIPAQAVADAAFRLI
ncbi:MAG: glycosyltransferase family 9 protein [Akkermansiaceae bacterium]|nr:glycosyltransferase family 9 protein [Armatimonadota bacterium]